MDIDEDKHLLGLAPHVVGAIGGAAIGTRDDLFDLRLRQGWSRLLRHRRLSAEQ
jgi:hypothetical protein